MRVQVLTNGSGKHEYSDDVLIVKLDSVLKGASVDIIPGLIMENVTDVYLYCLLYNIGHSINDVFSSPCQRQCELFPSLGVRRLSSVNFSYFNLLL